MFCEVLFLFDTLAILCGFVHDPADANRRMRKLDSFNIERAVTLLPRDFERKKLSDYVHFTSPDILEAFAYKLSV